MQSIKQRTPAVWIKMRFFFFLLVIAWLPPIYRHATRRVRRDCPFSSISFLHLFCIHCDCCNSFFFLPFLYRLFIYFLLTFEHVAAAAEGWKKRGNPIETCLVSFSFSLFNYFYCRWNQTDEWTLSEKRREGNEPNRSSAQLSSHGGVNLSTLCVQQQSPRQQQQQQQQLII